MSDSQTIPVAHKLIPSDQEGSNQWMMEMDEKNPRSHQVLVCSDLPRTECSKNYYLKKIMNFLTNCKQKKGKRERERENTHIYILH